MTRGPDNCVPLEEFRQKHGISPLMLELAIVTGSLAPVMHEGQRWVDFRRARVWLASEPTCPLLFAELGATMDGRPIVPRAATIDHGDDE